MNHRLTAWVLVAAVGSLGGCATIPTGPSVMVLPGHGKSFDQFQEDNAVCRQYARAQLNGVTAGQASKMNTLESAGAGALLGGALGAAMGEGRGAAIGAASGAALGTVVGSSNGSQDAGGIQQRYNFAYEQCMYAKGNQIPVRGGFRGAPRRSPHYPPPPPPGARDYPPPPPGAAPPGEGGD
ncbi:MAG: hypothetical protein B7Z66_07705 [Chromatiales bacterium 21-64-14]|nr:MAG: hypothetical protein B7Z66_07705 [Chromatiales bacterium 21-64-14]HQU15940.1 hypothetical protein [Gammaproteobacteria bacterium]